MILFYHNILLDKDYVGGGGAVSVCDSIFYNIFYLKY